MATTDLSNAERQRDVRIPLALEEITPEWLQEALSLQWPGITVKSAGVVELIHGASTKIRMDLDTDVPDIPRRIVIKIGFEDHSSGMKDMHMNEMHAFRDLVPTIEVNTPQCLFSGSDADDNAMVILEDLDLRQAQFQALQKPLTFEVAAGFLEGLAGFHSKWWGDPDLKTLFPWAAGSTEMRKSFYFDILLTPERFAHYETSPRGAAYPKSILDPERIARAHNALTDGHEKMPQTILHGDTHLGNLYRDADGTPGFLDWQARRGPWSLDVTYFLVAALDLEDRRRWEGALLQHYLACLRKRGVDAPTFDEAFEQHRRDVMWGLLIWLLNGTEFQTESNNTAAATRFGMAAVDHDTFALLGA